jgi:Zn finger protein HypA/HybF involved in hydrogenase expression
MNRKQRRAFEKAQKKGDAESKLARQAIQFEKLPEMCLTCEKPFDKKSKEMARTWNVVIKDEDTVRLYCPDCWRKANEIIREVMKNGTENRD